MLRVGADTYSSEKTAILAEISECKMGRAYLRWRVRKGDPAAAKASASLARRLESLYSELSDLEEAAEFTRLGPHPVCRLLP